MRAQQKRNAAALDKARSRLNELTAESADIRNNMPKSGVLKRMAEDALKANDGKIVYFRDRVAKLSKTPQEREQECAVTRAEGDKVFTAALGFSNAIVVPDQGTVSYDLKSLDARVTLRTDTPRVKVVFREPRGLESIRRRLVADPKPAPK